MAAGAGLGLGLGLPSLNFSGFGAAGGAGAGAGAVEENGDNGKWILDLTFEHGPILAHDSNEGRRLVTVMTAKKADGSIYWKSAFYRSTGKNSRNPGTWFPFLGLSTKSKFYESENGKLVESKTEFFSKSLELPEEWPKVDIFMNRKGSIPSKLNELRARIMARSFLLAANSLEALGSDQSSVQDFIENLASIVVSTSIDDELFARLASNKNFEKYKDLYDPAVLPASTSIEINTLIGDGLYFNQLLADPVNLRAFGNSLPNYYKIGESIWERMKGKEKKPSKGGSRPRKITRKNRNTRKH